MSDPNILAGLPVSPEKRRELRQLIDKSISMPAPFPNSEVRQCANCQLDVWQGPRQLAFAKANKCVILCTFCLAEFCRTHPMGEVLSLGNPDGTFED